MKGFKNGTGTRSSLLWQQMRLLEAALEEGTAPDYLLYENVKTLVSSRFREDFERLLDILRSYGYTPHWKVMNARECGIPQHRERVFMLCIREGAKGGGFTFPRPFTGGKILDEILSPSIGMYPFLGKTVLEYLQGHIKDGILYPPDRIDCFGAVGTENGVAERSRRMTSGRGSRNTRSGQNPTGTRSWRYGYSFKTKERQGGRAVGAAFPSCQSICSYNSVFISFTSVGRPFPKNMALQSENPNR